MKRKAIASLDLMNKVFEGEEPYMSKIGNVLSIYLLCSWLISKKVEIHPQLLHRFFILFFENLSIVGTSGDRDFSTYNIDLIQPVSDSRFIMSRNHILKKHLCLYEPKLIEYLDTDETKEFLTSMEESFREKSKQIQDLVKEINDMAIGSCAHKVFTLTGENLGIFTRMSYPIRGEEDYRELVELLWKAFYEGSNSSNKIPNLEDDRAHNKIMKEINVVIKINDLRMVEAHDLEQDPATYETKVKNACMIRDLYTGKKHVRDFNSNDFIIFQYRIVNELFDFMKQFSKSFR